MGFRHGVPILTSLCLMAIVRGMGFPSPCDTGYVNHTGQAPCLGLDDQEKMPSPMFLCVLFFVLCFPESVYEVGWMG